MERQGESCGLSCSGNDPVGNGDHVGESSVLSGKFFFYPIGEVVLSLNSNELSWKSSDPSDNDGSTRARIGNSQKSETVIKYSDIYAVEFAQNGSVHCSKSSRPNSKRYSPQRWLRTQEMCWLTVHGLQISPKDPCLWKSASYTFGHVDLQTCQMWMGRLDHFLKNQARRPRNLLVFVHPRSGKGHGCRTWESVNSIFNRAKINTKVIVTERAGHAFDFMASISNEELHSYDGIVAVGGDGFFNEILNGYLLSRLKVPLPPTPFDSLHSALESEEEAHATNLNGSQNEGRDHVFNGERLRFGLIPAGSTDAIVLCTTGARDPITSSLHIVLGREVSIDAVQLVRWKTTSTSKTEPFIRYAASFAGYGFYGDVISESEKYRWMGPKRYDYAGTKVYLKHRSYEAEVTYEEDEAEKAKAGPRNGKRRPFPFHNSIKSEKTPCRVGCSICNSKDGDEDNKEKKWGRCKGRYLSIGAAVMSNRNERAPNGLVADAHLSDGFLHLVLIKDCSRPNYLWHLTELAKRGGDPLNFEFVECHKTRAFTFRSSEKESVWNVDGEMFEAHQLSAQVLRALIPLFASGPAL